MNSTFEIQDFITLSTGDIRLDLHNWYDFVGYTYRPTARTLRLEWIKSNGGWEPPDIPSQLVIEFHEVANLVVQPRDNEMPFTEDDCLSHFFFLPPEFEHEYMVVLPGHRSDDEHVSLGFQSGAQMKIWAGSATHQLIP